MKGVTMKSIVLFGLLTVFNLFAFDGMAKSRLNLDKEGRIAKGYDVVAYFNESKPVKGKEEFKLVHDGATYLFSSKENLESFKASPEKYVPAFNGYCAYGVSQEGLYDIDPEAFTVYKDHLYLNLNPRVKKRWDKDRDGYIKEANENFPELIEGLK